MQTTIDRIDAQLMDYIKLCNIIKQEIIETKLQLCQLNQEFIISPF